MRSYHCVGVMRGGGFQCKPFGTVIKKQLEKCTGGEYLIYRLILALKVILLDRLHGINCSVIQEP